MLNGIENLIEPRLYFKWGARRAAETKHKHITSFSSLVIYLSLWLVLAVLVGVGTAYRSPEWRSVEVRQRPRWRMTNFTFRANFMQIVPIAVVGKRKLKGEVGTF